MSSKKIRVADLFAGVGGFRLGLEGYNNPDRPDLYMPSAGPYETVWANQWEPPGTTGKQFAWRCYETRFGAGSCVNMDINQVLNEYETGSREIPDFDLLVGGFPCQDYSVAKPLNQSGSIEGQKGVLWWDIYRMLKLKSPRYLLLENVDRLLKSPVKQRGRDFAIILTCLSELGYSIEWRVINAADYGMPQKRRRVFIFGVLTNKQWDLKAHIVNKGIFAKTFSIQGALFNEKTIELTGAPHEISASFGVGSVKSVFENAGVMQNKIVFTAKVTPEYQGDFRTLGSIALLGEAKTEHYYLKEDSLEKWEFQRSAKRIKRVSKSGHEYVYSEGAMSWPDSLEQPARTILTGEGGSAPSRMKHVILDSGRYRRLLPDELDMLQTFPKGWTDTDMSDNQRAFCMGNALVVEIPHRIGKVLYRYRNSF